MADNGLLSLLRKRLFPQKEANGQQQDGAQTVVGSPGFSLGDIILGAASGYAKGSQAGVPEAGLASGLGTGYETAKSLSDRRRVDDALRGFEGSPEFKTLTPVEQAEFRASPSTFFQKKREPKVKVMLSTLIPNVDKSIDREVELDPEALARFAKPPSSSMIDPAISAVILKSLGVSLPDGKAPPLSGPAVTGLVGAGNLKQKQQEDARKQQEKQEKANALKLAAAGQADLVSTKVDQALAKVGPLTAGVGSSLASVRGTPARDLEKDIDTIKANLGFETLQEMRRNSPTGGALGAIAVQELNLLQSTVASLDTSQSPEQLRRNLIEIKNHVQKWKEAVGQGPAQAQDDFSDVDQYLEK